MHLFLQGERGVGKSSLLREALRPAAAAVSGFVTQRLIENGVPVGYRAAMANGVLPPLETAYVAGMDSVFLLKGQKNISILEKVMLQLEQDGKKQTNQLILLDEIGGIELGSSLFMELLRRLLGGEKPCVGVLKSAENLAHMSSVLKLGAEYSALHRELEAVIRSNGELWTVTDENKKIIRARLYQHVTPFFSFQSGSF